MRAIGYAQKLQRWDFSTRYVQEHELDEWYLNGYEWTGAVVRTEYNTELYEVRHQGAVENE